MTSSTKAGARTVVGGKGGGVRITQAQYDGLRDRRVAVESALKQKKADKQAYARDNKGARVGEGVDPTLFKLQEDVDLLQNDLDRIDDEIAAADIISEGHGGDVVEVGSKATVRMQTSRGLQERTFTIATNGDPKSGYISEASPLAQALLGRSVGEDVTYCVEQNGRPGSPQTVRITKIE